MDLRLSAFHLPPVRSALVVGKRSSIGPNALEKALQEMMPGSFRRVDVEHDVIQSLLVNEVHLRRLPEDELVALVIRHAEGIIDASETLHVEIEIELHVREDLS